MLCLAAEQAHVLCCEQPKAVLLQGGILSIDIDPTDPSVVATAGVDHNVHIFSRQVLALLPVPDGKRRLLPFAKVTYNSTRQFATSLCAHCDELLWG